MTNSQRSPRFPSIPLEKALRYLQLLFKHVNRSKFLLEDAARAWDYAPSSGGLRVMLGALRQYGLVEGKVGEPSKISGLGLSLAINDPTSAEFFNSLESVALVPALFGKAQNEYGDLADSALKARLMLDHKFSESGALKFIESYRSTLEFVERHRTNEPAIVDRDRDDSLDEDLAEPQGLSRETSPERLAATETLIPATPRVEGPTGQTNIIPLQLLGGKSMVTIQLPTVMSAGAWDQMMAMLAALRPGYIQMEETEEGEGSRASRT